MKRLGLFIIGFFVGFIAMFAAIYASGHMLQYTDIWLYDSEDDMRRNVRIVLGLCLLGGVLSGYFLAKSDRFNSH